METISEISAIKPLVTGMYITPLKLPPRKFIDQTKLPGGLQTPMPMPDFFFDFSKESGIKKYHTKTVTQKNPPPMN